jgi:hypothetical protein
MPIKHNDWQETKMERKLLNRKEKTIWFNKSAKSCCNWRIIKFSLKKKKTLITYYLKIVKDKREKWSRANSKKQIGHFDIDKA